MHAQSLEMIDAVSQESRGQVSIPIFPSAGSVFRRPPGDYAGRLIEEAGCKGMRVGDALVSDRHANFIVNAGHATAREIMELIVRDSIAVFEKSGVYLELEQIPLSARFPCIALSLAVIRGAAHENDPGGLSTP